MAKEKIKIEWRNQAVTQFKKISKYLESESDIAVAIVCTAILDEIKLLEKHPTAHPLDRFKKSNNGNFRAFIVFCYRISYLAENETVYILRIRHTSREPLEH